MKRFINLFIVTCASLVLAGCAHDFDDIFNHDNEDVFDAVDLFNGFSSDPESTYQYPDLIASTISKSGGKMPVPEHEPYAMVINERNLPDGWPEIDFENYSLVVGWFYGSSNDRIVRQRLQINATDNEAILYLELGIPHDDLYDGTVYDYHVHYFAAIYPKFNSKISVVWRRYDHINQ